MMAFRTIVCSSSVRSPYVAAPVVFIFCESAPDPAAFNPRRPPGGRTVAGLLGPGRRQVVVAPGGGGGLGEIVVVEAVEARASGEDLAGGLPIDARVGQHP